MLHGHTCDSSSFANEREKFVSCNKLITLSNRYVISKISINFWFQFREHDQETGPVEFFIKYHKKKNDTFLEPITQHFVVSNFFFPQLML